jgi:hypothetical protein
LCATVEVVIDSFCDICCTLVLVSYFKCSMQKELIALSTKLRVLNIQFNKEILWCRHAHLYVYVHILSPHSPECFHIIPCDSNIQGYGLYGSNMAKSYYYYYAIIKEVSDIESAFRSD